MNPFRKKLVAFVTFIGGLYFFLEYILPETVAGIRFAAYHEQILKALQIISIATIGLGIINIVTVYGSSIVRGRKGWGNSLALMFGFLLMLGCEFWNMVSQERTLAARQEILLLARFAEKLQKEPPSNVAPQSLSLLETKVRTIASPDPTLNPLLRMLPENTRALPENDEFLAAAALSVRELERALAIDPSQPRDLTATITQLKATSQAAARLAQKGTELTLTHRTSRFVEEAFWIPLTAAIFSLLAFFMATAAYRAFRVRSLEAALIMGSALLVILGQIPHGPLYISESLPHIRLWLLKNVNTPAFRAIYFGSTVAGLALAVRIWFSLERSPIDRES